MNIDTSFMANLVDFEGQSVPFSAAYSQKLPQQCLLHTGGMQKIVALMKTFRTLFKTY